MVGPGRGELVHAAVVVPFHVSYGSGGKDRRDGVDDEVLHLWQRDVEDELVAGQGAWVGARGEHPVRVLVIEGRVGVDHLWLEP